MEQTINTIYGVAVYSHTENDNTFYRNDDIYSYDNGYAIIHRENEHDIYKISREI